MIIELNHSVTSDEMAGIHSALEAISYKGTEIKTNNNHYVIGVGKGRFDIRGIGKLAGVKDVYMVKDQYKLVSRQWRVHDTVIDLGDDVLIGPDNFTIVAGPCSVESVEHGIETVEHLHKNGIRIMRCMVFKPRTSPYSFRGLGLEGLKEVSAVARQHGMKINSEVLHPEYIDDMLPYIDVFQVGARNSQNYTLLDALGRTDKTIILKRGMSQSLEELLHAAEYIFSNGNENIVLCERGIRTFENAYRNTFDLNAIPVLQEKSHLPVIADPSHGMGIRRFVPSVALSAIMAGADGILMEVHETPEEAFSDGAQCLSYPEAERLYETMKETHQYRSQLNLAL